MVEQDNDCARKVWAVLPSFIRTISAHLRQQEPRLDVTLWQIMAMKLLRGEALTVGDMARKFLVSTPTMTRLLDNLVHRGLVERREDTADRRRVRLFLTDKGEAVFQELDRRALACVENIVAGMDDADRRRVVDAMEVLQQALLRSSHPEQRKPANG